MKTYKFENKEDWLAFRKGKITGSVLGDVTLKRGGGYKKGYYELIASKVSIPDIDGVPLNAMDRGHHLEPLAVERFAKETGKNVNTDLVIWTREENEDIAISPDGYIGKTEALECKCLNTASHLEAYLENKVPAEYDFQILQYFIVNDKLKTLYFAFYNPCIPAKDFFYFTIQRKSLEKNIKDYLAYELQTLREVDEIVNKLSF